MAWNLFGGGTQEPEKSWRDEAPSRSQLDLAESMDIPVPPGITQGGLSDLITAKKEKQRKGTAGIIKKLKKDVAQLQQEVGGLKKKARKAAKKKKK